MKGIDLYNAMAKAHAWDNSGASPEAPMNQYIINNNWKLATVNISNLQQPTGAVKDDEDSDDQLEVETIIWRKKEYFMLEEGDQKKVFEITEDDDLGKEVGLWIDNKLVRHDKKKK